MMQSAHRQYVSDKPVEPDSGHASVLSELPPPPDDIKQAGASRGRDLRSTLSRWRQLFGVLRRFGVKHRRWLGQGVVAAVGVTLLRLALPWPLQALLLPLLNSEHTVPPAWIPGGLDVTLVAGALFAVCVTALGYADARARLSFARFSIGTVRDLRKQAMRGVCLGLQPKVATRSGDMVARLIGDTARVKAGLKGFLVHVAVNGLLLVGITVVMLYIDVTMGCLFGLCIVAVLGVTFYGAKNIYETAAKYRKKEGRLAQEIVKVAKSAKSKQGSVGAVSMRSRQALATYKKVNRSSGRSEARITRLTGHATWASHALLGLFVFVALLYGTRAMDAGTLSSARLLLFALYILSARTPVVQLARQGVRTGKILACLGRLDELIEAPGPTTKKPVTSL